MVCLQANTWATHTPIEYWHSDAGLMIFTFPYWVLGPNMLPIYVDTVADVNTWVSLEAQFASNFKCDILWWLCQTVHSIFASKPIWCDDEWELKRKLYMWGKDTWAMNGTLHKYEHIESDSHLKTAHQITMWQLRGNWCCLVLSFDRETKKKYEEDKRNKNPN